MFGNQKCYITVEKCLHPLMQQCVVSEVAGKVQMPQRRDYVFLYSSMPTTIYYFRSRALLINIFPTCLISLLAIANGVVMYAYYENCDPLVSGQIKKPDQMVPNMMTEAFYSTPGLAGIFVAAACSGTLR